LSPPPAGRHCYRAKSSVSRSAIRGHRDQRSAPGSPWLRGDAQAFNDLGRGDQGRHEGVGHVFKGKQPEASSRGHRSPAITSAPDRRSSSSRRPKRASRVRPCGGMSGSPIYLERSPRRGLRVQHIVVRGGGGGGVLGGSSRSPGSRSIDMMLTECGARFPPGVLAARAKRTLPGSQVCRAASLALAARVADDVRRCARHVQISSRHERQLADRLAGTN